MVKAVKAGLNKFSDCILKTYIEHNRSFYTNDISDAQHTTFVSSSLSDIYR